MSAESTGNGGPVTRQLLVYSGVVLSVLITVIFGFLRSEMNGMHAQLLRLETTVGERERRIATLEAARLSGEASAARADARLSTLEVRVGNIDTTIAAHRAATEKR